jgi:hypothetical protein
MAGIVGITIDLQREKRRRGDESIMKSIDYWDRKVKKLGILELKMAQAATMGFTLLIVKPAAIFWAAEGGGSKFS